MEVVIRIKKNITTNNAAHICLDEVGQDIAQQAYSTIGIEYWTVMGDRTNIKLKNT